MIPKVLSFQTLHDLGVVQLTTSEVNSFKYITGSAAIERQLLEVTEISQQGSVNHLSVTNTSDEFVFFMDGEILSGAKQNRVINTSVLLAPHLKTRIPVSCVEQGRWGFVSKRFASTDYAAPPSLRHAKSAAVHMNLKESRSYMADQREIWDRVELMSSERKVHSQTSNLSDVYESHRLGLDEVAHSIASTIGANGIALFVGQELVGIDVFNRQDVYAEYFPKILRGIAFEMMRPRKKVKKLSEAEARFKTEELFDRIMSAAVETYQGVGIGEEKRFSFERVTGLRLEHQGKLIHMTAVRDIPAGAKG